MEKEFRTKLFDHIKENAKKKEIVLHAIGGHLDHVHCLIGLNAEQSISKVAMLLKGESAFWTNKNSLLKTKLEWAVDYYAGSLGEERLEQVRAYILNQEEHHSIKTFAEEYEAFLKENNLIING